VLVLFSGIWHNVDVPEPSRPDLTPTRNEIDSLRERAECAEREREVIRREAEGLRQENERLREQLETARRAGRRQAPFSKSRPSVDAGRPARKPAPREDQAAHRDDTPASRVAGARRGRDGT